MNLYSLITLKRKLEEVIMWPFVRAGKIWAARNPLLEEYDIFFFFPIYGLGGAEKVNAAIINCVQDKNCVVFFTRKSTDSTMLHLFKNHQVSIHDISASTDNKWRYWCNLFYRGVCAYYINTQKKKPVVFNGQCNFAYKLFPHINADIKKIELIHNSYKHFAFVVFPYVPFIDKRIMITKCHIADYQRYYDEIGISELYKQRITKILNKIEVPKDIKVKDSYPTKLNVYYAGRGGPQKRIWLLLKAIEQCTNLKLPVNFHLAGNFQNELPDEVLPYFTFHGQIKGGEEMNAFHQKMDVLMMTSAFEGFPMVIMEAMINGVVPIATAVDGVPEHITDGVNGLLIFNAQNEEQVVTQLVKHITYVCNNREHLKRMSANAFEYASTTFSEEKFCSNYRTIMEF